MKNPLNSRISTLALSLATGLVATASVAPHARAFESEADGDAAVPAWVNSVYDTLAEQCDHDEKQRVSRNELSKALGFDSTTPASRAGTERGCGRGPEGRQERQADRDRPFR